MQLNKSTLHYLYAHPCTTLHPTAYVLLRNPVYHLATCNLFHAASGCLPVAHCQKDGRSAPASCCRPFSCPNWCGGSCSCSRRTSESFRISSTCHCAQTHHFRVLSRHCRPLGSNQCLGQDLERLHRRGPLCHSLASWLAALVGPQWTVSMRVCSALRSRLDAPAWPHRWSTPLHRLKL